MTLTKACVAELVGTFAICVVGGGAAMSAITSVATEASAGLTVALATGFAISAAVSATMYVSGGHLNPAITLAMLAVGRCRIDRAVAYLVAQILGGLLAGYVLGAVFYKDVTSATGIDVLSNTRCGTPMFEVERLQPSNEPLAYVGDISDTTTTQPSDDPAAVEIAIKHNPAESRAARVWSAAKRAAVIEAVLTFLLVFAYFGTVVDQRRPNIGGFGVGLMALAAMLAAAPLSGAGMNPARVIGTGFLAGEVYWETAWLVYCVGPIAGAIFAGITYHFLVMDRTAPAA